MNEPLLKILIKYIVIIILNSLLFAPWRIFIDIDIDNIELINNTMYYVDLFLTLFIVVFLIRDSYKLHMKKHIMILIAVCGWVYPVFGVVVFSLIYLTKLDSQTETLE